MKIRFQADVDLNEDIVRGVLRREPGVDFRTAFSADFPGLSDLDVLALAAADGRVLVSHDRKTMPHNFADFIRTNTSPGPFIISQRTDVLAAVEGVLLIWSASEPEEWINRICTIPLYEADLPGNGSREKVLHALLGRKQSAGRRFPAPPSDVLMSMRYRGSRMGPYVHFFCNAGKRYSVTKRP